MGYQFRVLCCVILFCTGVDVKCSIEKHMQEAGLAPAEYQCTATKMADYLLKSRADNTTKKYWSCFELFHKFCKDNKMESKPALPICVAMYITNMIDQDKSHSVISSSIYAIKWVHNLNDLSDPTESGMVKQLLEASKRLRSKPVHKKDVVDSEILISLCNVYKNSSDIIELRDLSMIMLAYAGFMRISEVCKLKCNDVEFKDDHIVLRIVSSKTDVYRKGSEIVIAKGQTAACPYSILRRYVEAANLSLESTSFIFKPAFRSKSLTSLITKNKPLSYTRARECIVKKLSLVAPELNIHSLRASGATVAANTSAVSDRCLKRHGRWKSDSSKDGYIEDSLEKRLYISKVLNL